MNYWSVYERLIKSRLGLVRDGYSEEHHIIPRSLGGSDDPENMVRLTYREHFLVHWLLSKMFSEGVFHRKMQKAFTAMTMTQQGRLISSWQIEIVKRANKDRRLNRIRKVYYKRMAREAFRKNGCDVILMPPGLKRAPPRASMLPKKSHEERLAAWKAKRGY